jgi:hypothetical protein
MGEAAWERRLAANEYLDETHAPVVQPPGLYLVQVGVNSDQQGRGFGGCCCNPSFPGRSREPRWLSRDVRAEQSRDLSSARTQEIGR